MAARKRQLGKRIHIKMEMNEIYQSISAETQRAARSDKDLKNHEESSILGAHLEMLHASSRK